MPTHHAKEARSSIKLHTTRNKSVDFLRGTAIILMLVTHINSFFLDNNDSILDYVTWAGATLCFTIFLFCFGFGYGHKMTYEKKLDRSKNLKRSLILLLSYYVTAITAQFLLTNSISLRDILSIFSFTLQPPFTEFMIPFAIFTFLLTFIYDPMRSSLQGHRHYSFTILLAYFTMSVMLYITSHYFLSSTPTKPLLKTIKILFIGQTNMHTFPILEYSPIFIFGLTIGYLGRSKKLSHKQEHIFTWKIFWFSLILIGIISFMKLSTWKRWPPSILFLLIGINFISLILVNYKWIKRIKSVRSLFIYLGENSLIIFMLNVFIIIGVAWFRNFQLLSEASTVLMNVGLIFIIIVLTSIINLIRRKYQESKDKPLFIRYMMLGTIFFIGSMFLIYTMLSTFFPNLEIHKKIIKPAEQVIEQHASDTPSCFTFKADKQKLFTINFKQNWILLGSEFDEKTNNLDLEVALTTKADRYLKETKNMPDATYEIPDLHEKGVLTIEPLPELNTARYTANIDIKDWEPGKYTAKVEMYFPCGPVTIESKPFYISYPLYVVWSHDWEGYSVKQQYLDDMDELAEKHHNFPLTHFFNPRIYVTNSVSASHAEYLTQWVIKRRDERGDSIGLHLHMFPDMVKAALNETAKEKTVMKEDENGNMVEVTKVQTLFDVRTSPKWGSSRNDGYDILVTAYPEDEIDYILKWSRSIFYEHGLGSPIAFRAGGWMANLETLRALENNGFLLDSSGRSSYYLGSIPVPWSLSATTQPYQPNKTNQNSASPPNMNIWEFPNNGADSWHYSDTQMINRLKNNWKPGTVLNERKTMIYLSHPHWFNVDKPKMDKVLKFTDQYYFKEDKGPIIYINLDDLYKIWTQND